MKILPLFITLILVSSAYSDGYIKNNTKYLYVDDDNNEITCTVQELCDIALVKNDTFVHFIMTKGTAWEDSARHKTSYLDNNEQMHLILQATDTDNNNPVILIGSQNQYHFNLKATTKKSINRYVFIEHNTNEISPQNVVVDDGLELNFTNKKLNNNYSLSGDTKSDIRPIGVFNDGQKTYIKMSPDISQTDLPTVYTVDDDANLQITSGVRYRKPYFIIDSVRNRYALIVGSSTHNQTRIDIKLKRLKLGWFND